MDPSDNEPYQRAKKFIENPLDIITKDLKELKYTYLIESLKCEGPSAKLASAVSGGRVMLETAAILANNIEFIETWKNSTNPVDITLMKKITNYSPFIAARINAKILMQAIKNVKNS